MLEGIGGEFGWWCPTLDTAGAGTTSLTDLTGSVGNFAIGADWWKTEGDKRSLVFQGSRHTNITPGPQQSSAVDFSISWWQKYDSGTAWSMLRSTQSAWWGWYSAFRSVRNNDFGAQFSANQGITSGVWQHCAIVQHANSHLTGWVDGVSLDSGALSVLTGFTDHRINLGSSRRTGNDSFYVGELDDIRYFPGRKLDAKEVSWLGRGRGKLGSPYKYPSLHVSDVASYHAPKDDPESLIASDQSGSNDGTLANGASRVLSEGKLAYDFDGVDDYIDNIGELGTFAFIQNTTEYTIHFWLRLKELNRRHAVLGNALASVEKGCFVAIEYLTDYGFNALSFQSYYGTTQRGNCLGTTDDDIIIDLDWHPATYVGTSATRPVGQWYVDGVPVTTTTRLGGAFIVNGTLATGNSTRTMNIGRANHSSHLISSKAELDDIRFYNRALSATEVGYLHTRRGAAYQRLGAGKIIAAHYAAMEALR